VGLRDNPCFAKPPLFLDLFKLIPEFFFLEAFEEFHAPWFVIPADFKWAARTFVAEVIVNAIEGLNLKYPEVTEEQINKLLEAKKKLLNEK